MKLADLAKALKLELHGDAAYEVNKLAPIASASANELSFVVSARYREQLLACRAGAIIVPASLAEHASGNYLISNNPYASYAKASWLLTPEHKPPAGIATTACIDPSAKVSSNASIGEHCVIGAHTLVADGVVIGAHCVLGDNVSIGVHTRIFPKVSVYDDCTIGEFGRIQSGAVIGAEGFGFAYDNGWHAIHQTGRVIIGNKVHIGANTTIDRGAIEDTIIADGVLLDNQIQIAHNVRIGENTAIAGCVGIAGSTYIGANCQIGGACNIVGHLEIVDNVVLNATSYVTQSIKKPGRYSSGMPLQTSGEWKRSFVILSRLNDKRAESSLESQDDIDDGGTNDNSGINDDSGVNDIREVLKYLPHRYPFLLIDRVLRFDANGALEAIKNVSFNEPIFTGHFPQSPIFPGVLILEAMAQACALHAFKSLGGYPSEETLYLLAGIDKARFKQQVIPGDQLLITVNLTRSKRGISKFDALGTVAGKTVCTSEIIIAKNEIEL